MHTQQISSVCCQNTPAMPAAASPLLVSLQRFIQSGLQKCLSVGSDNVQSSQRNFACDFHSHIARPDCQQACHAAVELEEVLLQVFQHLDSRTLCTTIPLICQHWRVTAASEQLWAKRCDLQLLSALQKHHALHTSTFSLTPEPYSNKSDSRAACAQPGTRCGEALTPLSSTQYVVRLPLLHHAVYGCNLLRNPLFLAAANNDQSMVQRWRSSSAGSSWKAQAVLTDKQRKFAWVSTAGPPSWEQLPAGSASPSMLQPPLPLRYPSNTALSSSSSSLHSQLQEWLLGKTAGLGSGASSGLTEGGAGWAGGAGGLADAVSTSYLATGSNWTEVVQVVDLLGELTARGLDHSTAAAVLDEAGLAVSLSFWVAAAPDGTAGSAPLAGSSTATLSAAAAVTTGQHTTPSIDTAMSGGHPSSARATATLTPAPALSEASGGVSAAVSSRAAEGVAAQSPAQFAAALMLDNGQVPLQSFQTFVLSDSSHHFFSKRLAVSTRDGWRRYAYLVPCCPKGVRRAVVLLRGRGTGPGSNAAAAAAAAAGVTANGSTRAGAGGSGGVRFACAQLCFIRREEVEGFGAEECLTGWQDRVVQGF